MMETAAVLSINFDLVPARRSSQLIQSVVLNQGPFSGLSGGLSGSFRLIRCPLGWQASLHIRFRLVLSRGRCGAAGLSPLAASSTRRLSGGHSSCSLSLLYRGDPFRILSLWDPFDGRARLFLSLSIPSAFARVVVSRVYLAEIPDINLAVFESRTRAAAALSLTEIW